MFKALGNLVSSTLDIVENTVDIGVEVVGIGGDLLGHAADGIRGIRKELNEEDVPETTVATTTSVEVKEDINQSDFIQPKEENNETPIFNKTPSNT